MHRWSVSTQIMAQIILRRNTLLRRYCPQHTDAVAPQQNAIYLSIYLSISLSLSLSLSPSPSLSLSLSLGWSGGFLLPYFLFIIVYCCLAVLRGVQSRVSTRRARVCVCVASCAGPALAVAGCTAHKLLLQAARLTSCCCSLHGSQVAAVAGCNV